MVLLAGATFDRFTGPFGNADEGLNSSVWAMCTRALRDDPVESALGGRRPDGVDYANHPPLTCLAGAAAETIAGEHPAATRAPAWLASLSLVPLCWLLLRRMGLEPVVASAATIGGLGTPMLSVYGPMLDTPVVALPTAVGVTLLWAREWDDGPVVAPAAAAGLALLSGLAGWQAAACSLLAGAALVIRGRDRGRGVPYLAGAGVGVALSLAWAWWVYGSFATLADKLRARTGSQGLAESLSFQLSWIRVLFGASAIGLVLVALALRDRRWRPVAGLTLASGAVYPLVFWSGAGGHQYWNFFLLLPVTVGWGWGLGRLAAALDERGTLPVSGGAAALGLGAAVALVQLSRPTLAERLIDEGAPTGTLVASASLPQDLEELPVVGDEVRIYAIVVYETGLRPVGVDTVDQLAELAAVQPDTPVLVVRPCPEEPIDELCEALGDARSNRSELVPAAELAARLE